MFKFKYIRSKIITAMTVLVATSLLFTISISSISAISSTNSNNEENLHQMAKSAADRVKWELQAYQNITIESGTDSFFSDLNESNEEKKVWLSDVAEYHNLERGNIIYSDGIGIDGNDYSEREYFKKAMEGKTFFSDPLISKVTGKITIIVSAPLYEDGDYNNSPMGCVYYVPHEEFLNDIVRSINISNNSHSYIINKEGKIIADVDSNTIAKDVNYIKQFNSGETQYKELSNFLSDSISGHSSSGKYSLNNKDYYIGYSPIEGTDGWSIVITAPTSDFLNKINKSILITILLSIISLGIAIVISILIGNSIGNPISSYAKRLKEISEGQLDGDVDKTTSTDEVGILANATKQLQYNLQNIIFDIKQDLSNMAKGDFSNSNGDERIKNQIHSIVYVGDFCEIKTSLETIREELKDIIKNINVSADSVSVGMTQVTDGASMLANGATTQAASIQELSSSLMEISKMINSTTDNTGNVKELADEAVELLNIQEQHMSNMVAAMNQISEKSNQINEIISMIDDISFQTHILALNAAIEAARVGEAGKGFSVVAGEVKTLAEKSSDAVNSTSSLINDTITVVKDGILIVNETADSLMQVIEIFKRTNEMIENIAKASVTQSESIQQINAGIEEISDVVQQNSAVSEEIAASCEQVSEQSNSLNSSIKKFKI